MRSTFAPHLDADRVPAVHRVDLDGVAPDAERALREVDVVALVVQVHEPREQFVAPDLLAGFDAETHVLVVPRVTEPVDRGDGGDDDDVVPREERPGRGVPESVDLVVHARVLVDVRVRLLDVRLGLIVVVVGDEVLDGVVREQLAEFLVELCGEGLVVRDDERRLLEFLDRPGDRVRLPGPRHAEQRLLVHPALEPLDECLDGFGLVAGRLEGGVHAEWPFRVGSVGRQRPGAVLRWLAVCVRVRVGVSHYASLGAQALDAHASGGSVFGPRVLRARDHVPVASFGVATDA